MESISGNLSRHVSPSLHAAARGTSTPTQTPLEFQLVVQYPKVYPPLAPLDGASLDLQLLGIKPLHTGINQGTGLLTSFHRHMLNSTSDKIFRPRDLIGRRYWGSIDPRLHCVNISLWTTDAIRNQFAAEAISLYLNMYQPWWTFFDTDLFLDDLISGNGTSVPGCW
jgi:hypothetical protein